MIDLHTHTHKSDGTDSPTGLMEKARQHGLSVVAVTDHDTTAGWDEAAQSASGIQLVRGIEMSTTFYGKSTHLLGYLLDPGAPRLLDHIAAMSTSRQDRIYAMVDAMAADSLIDRQALHDVTPPGATPGRPHIADALIARGIVTTRQEAFDSYLGPESPYYRPYYSPQLADAISIIHDAGGVAILAHPQGRYNRDRDMLEEAISYGLDGMEVFHRDNSDIPLLVDICEHHQMLQTGGSDYHGTGKINRLGENTTKPAVLDQIIERGTLEVVCP